MTNRLKTSSRSTRWQRIFAILLLVGFVIVCYFLLKLIFSAFSTLQKEVAAAIIVASATVLISVLSLIISKWWGGITEIRQEHRNKKIPIYKEFLQFWFAVLGGQKAGSQQVTEEEIIKFMSNFTSKLIFWGSDEFIRDFSNFRRRFANINRNDPSIDIMFELEKLIYTIRKDTGHKNRNLKKGDILALFINDIDKYI